jgi:hypothetical protein
MIRRRAAGCVIAAVMAAATPAGAQTLTYRGFVETRGVGFPQDAPNDSQNLVLDVLGREELFVEAASWLQFAAGLDVRANGGDEVDASWRVDVADRGVRRPALSVRRLSATLVHGPLTVDAGKQFIRWGKTDIVTPTDRFAPRDFLNVLASEFLAVRGLRAAAEVAGQTVEAVWVPVFTPSRIPLPDKRWTAAPAAIPFNPAQGGAVSVERLALPTRSQAGLRWGRIAGPYEYSLSFFDGLNYTPDLKVGPTEDDVGPSFSSGAIALRFPAIRMYGADAAVPIRWFTIKGEAAYFTSRDEDADEYVLYVIQLERQSGEWQFVGGYAGEAITARRARFTFAPDRGTARSVLGRASYNIDANRSVAFEGAIREGADGVYVKAEFSQARGQHWRTTLGGVVLRGKPGDFLGQYRRNSHAALSVRYSF